MAGSFFALFEDIATILDDVAAMTKVAATKTAGVLGDDLALNAQQVSGVNADRELPVVLAVAKGSFVNKLILVPAALAISYFAPWLITPLLMIGGAYLCLEGFEKIAHKHLHSPTKIEEQAIQHKQFIHDEKKDMVELERNKIKGAIRTDFILSGEIIVIALGTVANQAFSKQVIVVSVIAVVMTVGVYGLVAGIVRLDDLGFHLLRKHGNGFFVKLGRNLGEKILAFTPFLMRSLSVIGTIAMFLVGGGILAHGFTFLHLGIEHIAEIIGGSAELIIIQIANIAVGIIAGGLVLLLLNLVNKLKLSFKWDQT